jgi:hypothetical protein
VSRDFSYDFPEFVRFTDAEACALYHLIDGELVFPGGLCPECERLLYKATRIVKVHTDTVSQMAAVATSYPRRPGQSGEFARLADEVRAPGRKRKVPGENTASMSRNTDAEMDTGASSSFGSWLWCTMRGDPRVQKGAIQEPSRRPNAVSLAWGLPVVFIALVPLQKQLMENPSGGLGFLKVKIVPVQPGSADPADMQRTRGSRRRRTAPGCRDMPDSPDSQRVAEAGLRSRLPHRFARTT